MIQETRLIHTATKNNTLDFQQENGSARVRLFVLEENLFRVLITEGEKLKEPRTWTVAPGMEDIPFEGRDRLDLTPFGLPHFRFHQEEERMRVETSQLRADIKLQGFRITWYGKRDGKWVQLGRDRQTQSYNWNHSLGEGVAHYLERKKEEMYFGLGEKSGNINKHGRRYRMLNIDAMGYDAETTDPLYKHIPFYITYNPVTRTAFGLFYDNLTPSIFDMGSELDNYHGFYRYYHGEAGDLDYYLIGGPRVRDVVESYAWLTGKTAFAPRWSLGYSGSTMHYTDAPDAQDQLQRFIQDCQNHEIPCDSFQLSSGYTTRGGKRYVFHWNREKIPEPKRLIQKFHDHGMRLCANIKPCLLTDHPQYDKLREKALFVRDRSGDQPEISQFWDATGAYLDFTHPETIQWWKEQIKEKLLHLGIDSTWNDNNEYEIWDREAQICGFGKERPIQGMHPVMPLLMMKASAEAQREYSSQERPYLISRSGCPGMQRYAQTWTGDNYTSWKTLKYNIRMGIGLSLSGIYNFGHDVGGFAGPAPEPELFIRWVQNGILHPRFTIHSWNEDGTVNEPWMYPEAIPAIREAIQLRYRLLPYLYHLLYEAHTAYKPMIRPTFYDYDHDFRTFRENDDFMLGKDLLVASVVEKGARERRVYLPQNPSGWLDFYTGRWYAGGQTISLAAPLQRLPLMVRGNSLLPVETGDVHVAAKSRTDRGLLLFAAPQGGESELRLLEDDGISYGYRTGDAAWLKVRFRATPEKIHISLRSEGKRPLPYKQVEILLPKEERRSLYVGNRVVDPRKTGGRLTMEIGG